MTTTIYGREYYILEADAGTDITELLTKAFSKHKNVLLERPYVISRPVEIKDNCRLRNRGKGSISSPKMRIFDINGNDNSLEDVNLSPLGLVNPAGWAAAVIFIRGGGNSIRVNMNYNFSDEYPSGIWMQGPQSKGNTISGCKLNSVSINYDYGASYNIIEGNEINNSAANSISGIGNGNLICRENKILSNIIRNAGRVAIEDINNTYGTIAKGNTIIGSGVRPFANGQGMGISTVGIKPLVLGNIVKDFKGLAIEISGTRGGTVEGNIIEDNTHTKYGINLNWRTASDKDYGIPVIKSNDISGCKWAIEGGGTIQPRAIISENHIRDFGEAGIRLDCEVEGVDFTITNNKFYYERLKTSDRLAMRLNGGWKGNQKLINKGNEFIYLNGVSEEVEVFDNISRINKAS